MKVFGVEVWRGLWWDEGMSKRDETHERRIRELEREVEFLRSQVITQNRMFVMIQTWADQRLTVLEKRVFPEGLELSSKPVNLPPDAAQ